MTSAAARSQEALSFRPSDVARLNASGTLQLVEFYHPT
jgi:hypothetical protein